MRLKYAKWLKLATLSVQGLAQTWRQDTRGGGGGGGGAVVVGCSWFQVNAHNPLFG